MAPPELRARLVPNEAATLEIQSLSFEYTSVGITRPWFMPDVFKARFWKFYESGKMISDGGNPAHGRCPAYVAGLVLVRNLIVKPKPHSPANDEIRQELKSKPLMLGCFPLQKLPAKTPKQIALVGGHIAPTELVPALPMSAKTYMASPRALRAQPANIHTESAIALAPPPPKLADPATLKKSVARIHSAAFVRPPMLRVAAPAIEVSSGQPKSLAPPAQPRKQPIYIMALICKRIGKCPDPDPNLQW